MAANYSSFRAGIVCGVALVGAVLLFPLTCFGQHQITLMGEVRTPDRQLITTGVMLTLTTQRGSMVGTRPVDSRGAYAFDGLSYGTYILTVTADGFQTHEETVHISIGVPDYYTVNVTLEPEANRKVAPADLPALTDEAAPKSARKEYDAGAEALKRGDSKKARLHLENAVAEYPCYARAQAALAQVDAANRKPEAAELALKKAIQCDGTFLESYAMLAQLYITGKKYADSEAILRQGLRVAPSSWPLHYQMGRTHFAMENYAEAARDFEEALSNHPGMPADFHAQLANAYLATNQLGKALAEVETYLRLDPKGRFAASARRTSETLRARGVTPIPFQAAAVTTAKP